jgi:hypothetical protein
VAAVSDSKVNFEKERLRSVLTELRSIESKYGAKPWLTMMIHIVHYVCYCADGKTWKPLEAALKAFWKAM